MQPNSQNYSARLSLVRMGGQDIFMTGKMELLSWITNDQGSLQGMMLSWTPCFGIMLNATRMSNYGAFYSPPPLYEL